ncbi:hypothetical protein EBT25_02465 [bacterium]|nr:hypothetical protein [bacterium]
MCHILRLLMVKVDIAQNVALRNLVSLKLIDGIEPDGDLSNHWVVKVAVDGVHVRVEWLNTLKHLARKRFVCPTVQQVRFAWNLAEHLDILVKNLLLTSHQYLPWVCGLELEIRVVVRIHNQVGHAYIVVI